MKAYHILTVLLLIGIAADAQQPTHPLKDQRDTLSWAFGASFARQCLTDNMNLDRDLIIDAFVTTMRGEQQPLDEESYEMAAAFVQYMQYNRNKKMQDARRDEAARLEASFLQNLMQENPAVKYSDKGFCYEVLKTGDGRQAADNMRITFDYRGYEMLSGTLFDQTYDVHEPLTINLDESVFTGLHWGLLMMHEGDIYRFYIPFQLAFGDKGSKQVPPFTGVIFEVELHTVHLD